MSTYIDTARLKAMLPFVDKHDIRYFLHGIKITGDKMMATDGRRLTICRLPTDTGLDLIIPIQAVEFALKLNEDLDSIEVTPTNIGRVMYTPIDGKYPDVWKVIPADIESMKSQYVSFNPKYMGDYHKLIKAIKGCSGEVTIRQSDELSTIIVDVGLEDFFCLLMPCSGAVPPAVPSWVAEMRDAAKAPGSAEETATTKTEAPA